MRSVLALAALLALPSPPLAAQSTTHLNVAPSQMVDVFFVLLDPTSPSANTWVMAGLTRADGVFLGQSIPAGKMLILRDAQASFYVGPCGSEETFSFVFRREDDSYISFGASKRVDLRPRSFNGVNETITFDFPSGMSFTNAFKPRLSIYGRPSAISNMSLAASGYLVDRPASAKTLPTLMGTDEGAPAVP